MPAPRLAGSYTETPARARPAWVRARETLDAKAWHLAIAVVLAAGVVRLALAATTPLVPDEAYYWEWSRRLATGYYDHPPLIALLVRGGVALFGATPFGVRAVPVLAGTVTMLLVADLARRHGGGPGALRAAVVSSCVPLAAAGLVLATPDTPLLLMFAATLAALDRALAASPGGRESWSWWAVAGVTLGLGLASKYTMVLLPAAVVMAIAARRSLRGWLRAPEPWAATLIALAVFAPVARWNAERDWLSFLFQLNNGLSASGAGAAGRILDLVANQLVLASPVVLVMLAIAVAHGARAPSDRKFVLAVVASAIVAFFLYSALRQRPEPNWPAAAYLPALVLLATAPATAAWTRWLRRGTMLGALMVVVIYVQALAPILPIAPRKDPLARGHGWAELARAAADAAPHDPRTWFAANRYQDAAMLAFHLPGQPEVFSLNMESRPNQYDLWPTFPERAAPGASLVLALDESPESDLVQRALRPHFRNVRAGPMVELRRGDGVIGSRRVWILEGWLGDWP